MKTFVLIVASLLIVSIACSQTLEASDDPTNLERRQPVAHAEDQAQQSSQSAESGPLLSVSELVSKGQEREKAGDLDQAAAYYSNALEQDETDLIALRCLAKLNLRRNKVDAAANLFRRAIKLAPDNAGLHNDLGVSLQQLNNHVDAMKYFESAITMAPGHNRYVNNLAISKNKLGDIDGALQALLKHQYLEVAHFNMAYLHWEHRRHEESKRHLKIVLRSREVYEIVPNQVQSARRRAQELLECLEPKDKKYVEEQIYLTSAHQ